MTWAFGEVEHLVRKAVSGAGKPWGTAEEAGWAVRWLAERGLPGPQGIVECLDIAPDLCPIGAGMALADVGVLVPPCEFPPVQAPILMLPFLARMCPANAVLDVRVGSAEVSLSPTDVSIAGILPKSGTVAVLGVAHGIRPGVRPQRVAEIAPVVLDRLETFAARTYAPATEHSRRTGAGAGLHDND